MDHHQDIIDLIKSTPAIEPPDNLTPRVMARLTAEQSLSFGQLLRQVLAEAGGISWFRFYGQYIKKRESCSYFLLSGFFHFLMGTVVLSGLFIVGHLPLSGLNFWLLAILILLASAILGSAGLIIAFDLPFAGQWAKRLIILYVAFMFVNASMIHSSLKITSADLFTLSFAAASLMTGMVLWRSLETQTSSFLSLHGEC